MSEVKHHNRTICLRVAEVTNGGTKAEFYAELRKTLDYSRRIYNMAMSESVAQDSASFTLDGTIPKKAKIATYATLVKGKGFAAGVTRETANLLRAAESKYADVRFDLLRGKQQLPFSRSVPWPLLCNKSVDRLSVEHQDGNLYLTLRLMGGQWTVRVKSGNNFKHPIAGVINCLPDRIGDSQIWQDRKGVAVIGVSVKVEQKQTKVNPNKTLRVVSATNCLLNLIGERSPYSINADHLVEMLAQKRLRQQRIRQSIKPGDKRQVRRKLAKMSAKSSRRVSAFVHETTAKVVSFAVRNGFGRIEYDDSIRSYLKQWPWFDMAGKLKYKCEDNGIEFVPIAKPFEPCGDISQPHVYFRLHVAKSSGEIIGLKIGETQDGDKRNTTGQAAIEEVYVAAIEAPKTKKARLKLEKQWQTMFAEFRIENEVFHAAPVVEALRERGMIDETLGGSRLAELLSLLDKGSSRAVSKR